MFCAFILGHTLKGTILVGIALSQVGEFSFILAELGLDYQIISNFYFQLFLATAIMSMVLATEFKTDVSFTALSIMVTTLASFVTVAVWLNILIT